MKKIARIALTLVVVCLLAGYFFSDLDISGRSEMMTWDEFSANPLSVEHFRDRAALESSAPVGDQETRRAYERYVAAANTNAGVFSSVQVEANDRLEAFRSAWHRVYRIWPTLHKRSGKGPPRPRPPAAAAGGSERLGNALTLITLIAAVAGISFAIRFSEEKARV